MTTIVPACNVSDSWSVITSKFAQLHLGPSAKEEATASFWEDVRIHKLGTESYLDFQGDELGEVVVVSWLVEDQVARLVLEETAAGLALLVRPCRSCITCPSLIEGSV